MGIIANPIIVKNKKEPFKQKVVEVAKHEVRVMSGNGNIYPVPLSDKAKTYDIEVGDTAIVNIVNGVWLVIDIEKKEVEPELSPEEEMVETEKQLQEIISMWNY